MVNTSRKPLTNHLKSTLNNKKDGRNSSILFIFSSNYQQSLLSRIQKTLSTMITKNRADFIIAVMGNSIKCEKSWSQEFIPYSSFEALKVRDFGSNRCPITAIINKSARIRSNHKTNFYCLIFFWLCSGLAKIIRPAAV